MSYKDPADKERWSANWRKQSKTNGYNKWLYARRKVRADDAKEFRQALKEIVADKAGEDALKEIAYNALEESAARWQALGEPPHRRRSDVKLDGLDATPARPKNSLLAVVESLMNGR